MPQTLTDNTVGIPDLFAIVAQECRLTYVEILIEQPASSPIVLSFLFVNLNALR